MLPFLNYALTEWEMSRACKIWNFTCSIRWRLFPRRRQRYCLESRYISSLDYYLPPLSTSNLVLPFQTVDLDRAIGYNNICRLFQDCRKKTSCYSRQGMTWSQDHGIFLIQSWSLYWKTEFDLVGSTSGRWCGSWTQFFLQGLCFWGGIQRLNGGLCFTL